MEKTGTSESPSKQGVRKARSTKLLCFGVALNLLCFLQIPSAQAFWTSIGPDGAAISCLAVDPTHSSLTIDPTDPDILYAGTLGDDGEGNVFKSTDGGLAWKRLSSVLPEEAYIFLYKDTE